MKTDELINTLALDGASLRPAPALVWTAALLAAIVAAGCVFTLALGVRDNWAASLQTYRYPFKFVVTLSLLAAAWPLLRREASPTARFGLGLLWLVPALLACGVGLELWAVPPDQWLARLYGVNHFFCLMAIPAIGLLPLGAFMLALRFNAPIHHRRAGAAAGLAAGALAATFYASHCPDDSPLFVMVWYPLAIAILTLVGAALGDRLLRW